MLYTTIETLPITRWVKLIEKKEFIATALDSENEIFVVYVAVFTSSSSNVHYFCQTQIVSLKADETLTTVSIKYVNFADIFLPNVAAEFPEQTKINNHAINLIDGKQPTYGPIYTKNK